MVSAVAANKTQLELFASSLPSKPYATDHLGVLRILSKPHAIQKRYIQPNHPNSIHWLVFDIDRPISWHEIVNDIGLPMPTIMVNNPENGHAHVLYGLLIPVHKNTHSSMKALRFAAAIERAMTDKLQADHGYTGLICKNPLNAHWLTSQGGYAYDLEYLSEFIDLSAYRGRKRLPSQGLGRNVNLFESLRLWAYKAIRQGWPEYDQWLNACITRAEGINAGFDDPLPFSEIKSTGTSVAKYTSRHFSKEGFSAWQAAQGSKGGIAKGKAYESKRAEALAMLNSGMTATEVSAALSVHRNTITNWSMHK